MKNYCVYIITNKPKGTLYIGVTGNLTKRIWEHKNKAVKDFSKYYNLNRLVYFEQTGDVMIALNREKQLKKWNRSWKIDLIEKENGEWKDLSEGLV